MRPLLFLACLIIGPLASAENEKLPELKLKNGKTFTAVTITKKTADGIAIMHEAGTARIPFEQLPDDLVKTLGGFDPAKAAESRNATAQGEAAHYSEMEKAEAAQEDSEAAKKERTEEMKTACPAIIEVVQALPDGALCKVAWLQTVTQYTTTKDSFGRDVKTPKQAVASPVFEEAWIFVAGINAVDKDSAGIALIPTGENYSYESTVGARKTVRRYKVGSKAIPTGITPDESYERGGGYVPSRPLPRSSMRRVGGG
jgi:hypothetical protein